MTHCHRLAAALVLPAFLLIAAPVHLQASPANDYLPPDIRARVERLKLDLVEVPNQASNRGARARLLWEWANAWAMNGGNLPVNVTQTIGAILQDPTNPRAAALDDDLNAYVAELALLDEDPNAVGSLSATTGPYTARSYGTIVQTYTVGSHPIEAGGGIVVARQFMANFGAWQTDRSDADNFISVATSNPSAGFVSDTRAMRGMHGGFRDSANNLFFRVASGALMPGDTVTVTYGDVRRGSRGMLMPSFSSDRMPLPLYVVFREKGHAHTLPLQPVQIAGAELHGVHAFLPSIVGAGESFTVSVRGEDRWINRATGAVPAWQVKLNGENWLEIPASSEAITLVSDASIATPGAYMVTVESTDGRIQGTGNPILVQAQVGDRIFWGDTHGHSGFAEGVGTPDRFMTWARDDARLDYVTHSEHDIWLDDFEWEVLRDNVQRYTQPGEFIAYLGYEWTVQNLRGGHHNVLFRTPGKRNRVASQFYPTLSKLYQGLRTTARPRDIVVIPHAHQAGDYRLNDPELEPLIEIMSQHGNFEWFGRMYLNQGHQVGFTAASDNHLSQPGYSAPLGGSLSQRGGLGAVMAKEKTVDAVFDGLKQLSTYATTGERMIVEMSVNDAPMGSRAPFSKERNISGRVIGTAPIESITVIKNDSELWHQDYLTDTRERAPRAGRFLLRFASDSVPVNRGDNPRGWRLWKGTFTVKGANLLDASATDFHNVLTQSLTADKDDSNTFTFTTFSRGDSTSIELQLDNIKRDARIEITLEPAREFGGAPPIYRAPQKTPGGNFTLKFAATKAGSTQLTQQVDAYADVISLRRVIDEGKTDVSFTVTDTGEQQGDYYFVRIKQANDAIAWTSPVWIGGYGKQ